MKGCNNNLRDYMGKESVESGRILVILYGATSTSTSEMKVEKRHSSSATENVYMESRTPLEYTILT